MRRDTCLACANSEDNHVLIVQEMMLGTREAFHYVECNRCKSLQITDPPAILGEYYPSDYYSFALPDGIGLKQYLRSQRLRYSLGSGGVMGFFLYHFFGPPERADWTRMVGIGFNDRILDIGCGSGQLLADLYKAGFKSVAGLDPFSRGEKASKDFPVHSCYLSEWNEEQDLVMMHHSFEHMPEPERVLDDVRRILKPGGHALIRTPVANCFAWRQYGAKWVQLDAPRHYFIPSVEGMTKLAEATGFKAVDIKFDSTDFQFWGSELYQRDIRLAGAEKNRYFTRSELAVFRKQAMELNRQKDGDSACFLLRKI